MDKLLAMKIYNVMCATEAIEKDTIVGKGSKGEYKAVGEAAVLNMVKPLFKAQKLLIMPVEGDIKECVDRTIAYDKEGTRSITQLKVYFDIIDAETGESTRIVGFGNGADSQDKGSGKAFTYALKTALQKSFLMFSGEDTDNTHSDEIGKNKENKTNNKNVNASDGQTKAQPNVDKITTQQLINLAVKKGFDEAYLCKKAGTDQVKFIKAESKKAYYVALQKLPDKV